MIFDVCYYVRRDIPDYRADLEDLFSRKLARIFHNELLAGAVTFATPLQITAAGESDEFIKYRVSTTVTIRYRTMLVAVTWRPAERRPELLPIMTTMPSRGEAYTSTGCFTLTST